MTQREAAIHHLKELIGKPLAEKVKHILTYYWLSLVIIITTVAVIVSFACYWTTAKNTALHVTCLNATVSSADKSGFVQGFAQAAGIDTEKYTVEIVADQADVDSNMGGYDGEVLAAQIIAGMIDVLATDEETATRWLYQDVFADLSNLLSAEQLAQHAESILYMDAAVMQRIEERDDSLGEITYPDPTKPEEMEDPIPVLIRLSGDSDFLSLYFVGKGNVVLGILGNAPNAEYAVAFLRHLTD